jgi:hypothetical protein
MRGAARVRGARVRVTICVFSFDSFDKRGAFG